MGCPRPGDPKVLDGPYESGRIQVLGLLVQNYSESTRILGLIFS